MNWSFDSLFPKAKLYAARAVAEDIHSALFGFWMSLCLELLARASLSKIHPVLVADPAQEGNIHYAFGINPKANPRSVIAKTVFARCSVLIPNFTDQMSGHCLLMADRRNKELHTGEAAFEAVEAATWLPQTYEVVEVLLSHCGCSLEEFFGKQHAQVAQGMLKDRRTHLEKEVKDRVAIAKATFGALGGPEKADKIEKGQNAVKAMLTTKSSLLQAVDCPACGLQCILRGESLDRGPVKVDEEYGTISREVRVLPNALRCPTCELKLDSYQELMQVGLGKVFVTYEEEDPIEFFGIVPEEHVDIDKLVQEQMYEEMYGYQNE